MTLIERMRYHYELACRKHELAPDATKYANEYLNSLTNVELLEKLSEAFEELKVNFGTNEMDS